jgi:hypothetical protein
MKSRLMRGGVTALVCIFAFGCSEDRPPVMLDGGTDTGDIDTGSDTGVETGWGSVTIINLSAPDEYTVEFNMYGVPPVEEAADVDSYEIGSDYGSLVIESASYDSDAKTVTLTTSKQKLGITYLLKITADEAPDDLEKSFLSAETAEFWVVDFGGSGYPQYQITANRAHVGQLCVVYVEEGFIPSNLLESAFYFDSDVYPIETDLFIDAPDQDGNGRITILGLDGQGYYGGYFAPTNAYSEDYSYSHWGIHSNEMELIHINVAYGDFDHGGSIVPHEFQHLLYQERHGLNDSWIYHNEGLSESAVRAVNGDYQYAIGFYFSDYSGLIGSGSVSLVNWTFALYENYVTAFLFWGYIAGQLDGVATYSDIFHLDTGNPDEVNAFLEARMGLSFAEVQLNQMIATWVQDPTGVYGYEGFLTLNGIKPSGVLSGISSVDLEPFAGTYFSLSQDSVDYPGTQGADIVYAGIDSAGNVDLTPPFDKQDGALLVLNSDFEYSSFPTQHSGPDISAGSKGAGYPGGPSSNPLMWTGVFDGVFPPTWYDPPPYNPENPEPFYRWKEATEQRLINIGE